MSKTRNKKTIQPAASSKLTVISFVSLVFLVITLSSAVFAGNLDAPAAPTDSNSAMFTLEDIYNRLLSGIAGVKRSTGFVEPARAPGSTMYNLNQIMEKAPTADEANGATSDHVLLGKKYWGLKTGTGQWGLQTGTLQTRTLSAATDTVSAGNYAATTLSTVDADLATGNIKAGTTIFGVTGDANVVNTSSGDAIAGELFSGKKAWVDGAEVTGTLQTRTLSAATDTLPAGNYAATTLSTVDADLATGNIKAGSTIFGVTGDANVVNTSSGDAIAGELFSGKKAWVDGAEVTGTLQTRTLSAATDTVPAGNYAATTLSTVDADLVTGNIKAGTTIFGVTGDANVVNTSSGNATAGELLLNRKAWVGGQEITGTRTGGLVLKAGGTFSPEKRWYDNGDGTITDTTSGLIWLKNVGAVTTDPVLFVASNSHDVFILVAGLQNGVAGLSDGSAPGDWRVPTLREMQRLTSGTEAVLRDTPGFFIGIADRTYWTLNMGSAITQMRVFSFAVDLFGDRSKNLSMNTCYVMPVRSNY